MTLLFAQEVYERVAEAYMRGLENSPRSGGDVSKIASVASFFISRIDNADRFARSATSLRRPRIRRKQQR